MNEKRLESHNQNIDVEKYFEEFTRSDVHSVADFFSYIKTKELEINNIIFHELDKEKDKAIVYIEEVSQHGKVWHQVNWSSPGTPPSAYDRYAFDFYHFSGNHDIQLNRASILSEVLKTPLLTISHVPEKALKIPYLGVILLDNPLKSKSSPWHISTGS